MSESGFMGWVPNFFSVSSERPSPSESLIAGSEPSSGFEPFSISAPSAIPSPSESGEKGSSPCSCSYKSGSPSLSESWSAAEPCLERLKKARDGLLLLSNGSNPCCAS